MFLGTNLFLEMHSYKNIDYMTKSSKIYKELISYVDIKCITILYIFLKLSIKTIMFAY